MKNVWAIAVVLVMAGVAVAAPPPVPTGAANTNIVTGSLVSTVKGTLPTAPLVSGATSAPEFQFGTMGMAFDTDGQSITTCFQPGSIQSIELVSVCYSLDSPDTNAELQVEVWQIDCQYDPPGSNNANQNDAKRNVFYGGTGQSSTPAPQTGANATCVDFHADLLLGKSLTGSAATNGVLVRHTIGFSTPSTATAQVVFKAKRIQ